MNKAYERCDYYDEYSDSEEEICIERRRVPCENSLKQTSNINEEQMDLKDLFRISDDLRKNMADIFILLKNKQSYKEIEKNSVTTKDIIREKIIHSDLNEHFKSKVNLNSAKYVATCGMFTKKIIEIQQVKQSLRDQNLNDLKLNLPNWKDVYNRFKSLVVLKHDMSFSEEPEVLVQDSGRTQHVLGQSDMPSMPSMTSMMWWSTPSMTSMTSTPTTQSMRSKPSMTAKYTVPCRKPTACVDYTASIELLPVRNQAAENEVQIDDSLLITNRSNGQIRVNFQENLHKIFIIQNSILQATNSPSDSLTTEFKKNVSGESVHRSILDHLGNINSNMKEIENILQQKKTETTRKETKAFKLMNDFFQNLNQIINQDKKELVFDLCFLSFDLLIMAKYILEPFQINQSTNMKTSQLSSETNGIGRQNKLVSSENQTTILELSNSTEKQTDNFNWSRNDKQNKIFNEFKNKVTQCFDEFNVDGLKNINKQSINTKQLLTVVELIKQAFNIIQIVKCFQLNQDCIDQKDSIVNDMKNYLECCYKTNNQLQTGPKDDSLENIFEHIKKLFSNFESIFKELNLYSQKQFYQSADWNNEKTVFLQVLFKELIEFINKVDDENEDLINDFNESSLALIKQAGFYSSKAEVIEKQMVQEKNSFFEKLLDNDLFPEQILENDQINESSIITNEGYKIETKCVILIVPSGSIQNATRFTIKNCMSGLNFPSSIQKVSPALDLSPDSIFFTKKANVVFKNIEDENVCLFLHKSSDQSRKLNEWTVFYPNRMLNKSVEFNLNSLGNMFLGKMSNGLEIKQIINQLDSNSNTIRIPSYKYVKPGLNYRSKCENNQCEKKNQFFIINLGYGCFKIASDNNKKCQFCSHHLNKTIDQIILFQAKGSLELNDCGGTMSKYEFDLDDNSTLKLYGDQVILEKYKNTIITVNESTQKQGDANDVKAAVMENFIEKNKLPENFVMPSNIFVSRLDNRCAGMGIPHISLAWDNENDLDLHVVEPNGEEIYYSHSKSASGGTLDVDANVSHPYTLTPIENIFWPVGVNAPKGSYRVYVNYYAKHSGSQSSKYKVSILTDINTRKEFSMETSTVREKRLIYEFKL